MKLPYIFLLKKGDKLLSDLFSTKPPKKNRLNVLPDNPEVGSKAKGRFPSWLHRKLPKGGNLFKTNSILKKYKLNMNVYSFARNPYELRAHIERKALFEII